MCCLQICQAQCPDVRWETSITGSVYVDDLGVKAIYGDYTNKSDAQYVNDGHLYFFGNITNDGYFGDGYGKEYIKSCGGKTIVKGRGGTEFNYLEVQNVNGVEVAQNVRIKERLVFREGIISTDRNEASHRLTFYPEARYTSSSDNRHVNGRVAKQGQGTFVFPLGDGQHLSPLRIKGEDQFDFFDATYYSLNLGFLVWAQGGSFPAGSVDLNLQKVQNREYWKLKGSRETQVTLYWTAFSQINKLTDNINNLVVVGWDGDKWTNLGKTDVTAFLAGGTVTSRPFIPSRYSALTLGVADSDGDGYADDSDISPFDPCDPDPNSVACLNNSCVSVSAKVFLEGALRQGGIGSYSEEMSTRINYFGYLPGQKPKTLLGQTTEAGQPYNKSPWNYAALEGSEMGSSQDYDDAIVDWVLVSIRTTPESSTTICQKSALLKSNGEIIFTEFFDCCERDETEFYIVIEHRNHLPIMTPTPVPLVDGTISFDFTQNQSYTRLLGSGQKEVLPNVFAMYAGNGDQDLAPESAKDINSNDFSAWIENNGKHSGYYFQDFDLSGDVNVHDQALWLQNNGTFTDVDR